MKTKFHIEITEKVLKPYFSDEILRKIMTSNIKQDRLKFQIGHDYIHFDGSAFSEGFEYISQQTRILYKSLEKGNIKQAWTSLGRILHSWQDFYSHSNYVYIWLQKSDKSNPCNIDHKDLEIFKSPNLKSGKNYGILEFLAMIPGLSRLIKPLMPSDSHAKMNLDSPKSGSAFDYAYHAAKLRSKDVIEQIFDYINQQNFNRETVNAFMGK